MAWKYLKTFLAIIFHFYPVFNIFCSNYSWRLFLEKLHVPHEALKWKITKDRVCSTTHKCESSYSKNVGFFRSKFPNESKELYTAIKGYPEHVTSFSMYHPVR